MCALREDAQFAQALQVGLALRGDQRRGVALAGQVLHDQLYEELVLELLRFLDRPLQPAGQFGLPCLRQAVRALAPPFRVLFDDRDQPVGKNVIDFFNSNPA